MASYPSQFLYLSDALGCPTELFNGARLARNLQAAGCAIFNGVVDNLGCAGLIYAPGVPSVLSEAVLWLDAIDGVEGRQMAPNRGTGGEVLDAIYGAATSVGTDEPKWLGGSENYLFLPGVAGNYASVPDTAVLDITGDIEIIVRVSMTDWTPSAAMTIVSKYTSGSHGYELQLNTAGTLSLICRLAASDITATSSVAPTVADGQELWLRVTRASASGNVNFYTAPANPSVPREWGQLGTADVASTAGAIAAGSNNLRIGERPAGTQPSDGKFFRVILRNAIGAMTPVNVADIDFTLNTSQSSFVATAGGTVTITRTTSGRKAVTYMGRPLWLFGADDYLTIPDHNLLDVTENDDVTVMVVARTHNVAVGSTEYLLSKQANAAAAGWSLYNDTAATSRFTLSSTGSIPATGNKVAGQLHVIMGQRSITADTLTAYLDGTAGTPLTDTGSTSAVSSSALRVGSLVGGTNFFAGEILAVAVWKRALTAAEISEVSSFYRGAPHIAGHDWTTVDFTTAPWHNASTPASTEAYGFVIEEWTGIDGAHHRRSSTPTGQNRGGSFYGPQSHDGRVMKLNVLLHGSSERGLEYLFRWLEDQLLSCCDASCGSRSLWLREYCPTDPENAPEDGVARMERVVLMSGPTWEEPPLRDAGCYLRRASFTLTAGDPCMYRDPVAVASNVSTTSGVLTTNIKSTCATFVGNNRQTRADYTRGDTPFGTTAPIVTIWSPSEYSTGRKGLPVLRIAGYADPLGYGEACRAMQLGELILEGYESSGYEIVADLVQRRVLMRPIGQITWDDGSRLIGSALQTGMPRWWSWNNCENGFVVVEPAFTGLETARVSASSLQVSSWYTKIEFASRFACC